MDVTRRFLGRRSLLRTMAVFFSCPVLCHSSARQQDYGTGPACIQDISSARQKSGAISSPYYPDSYPNDVLCRFRFVGEARERIQVVFVAVNLNYMNGDANEPLMCEHVDTVTVSTWDDELNRYSTIGVYCGSKIPPRLMSSTNRMLVTFQSQSYSSGGGTGFQANYYFVTDCRFVYNSNRVTEDVFTSPNYPGLYPRNTTCEYRFYALPPQEQVYISFRYFDVEGIPPHCNAASMSDYLTISEDRPPPPSTALLTSSDGRSPASASVDYDSGPKEKYRYCVAKEERSKKSFLSESNFLQITFKSNSVFDAFGFEAFFQFRKRKGNDSDGSGSAPSALFLFRFNFSSFALIILASVARLFIAASSSRCCCCRCDFHSSPPVL